MTKTLRLLTGLPALVYAGAAFAGAPTTPVSEPGILGLIAAGGVVGLVVWVRKRRK